MSTRILDLIDIPAAIGLLTRLPVPLNSDHVMARGALAAWAYPVVGALIGGIAAAVAAVFLWFGVVPVIVAVLVVVLQVVLTGAMHEDGLADSADGLWGAYDRDRRLEIMKDSHIGVYGVIALTLSLILRCAALSVLLSSLPVYLLIALGALSRVPMVALMHGLANARKTGLASSVGRPPASKVILAAILAFAITVLILPSAVILLIGLMILCTVAVGYVARAKIGGQTGDILGASQQITECVLLISLTTLL
ncbi:adenosylcobinamide-GDP ribazoletransferase [Parasulfitobacter algicola]|uniref:adenosylcobinamide-GDP ribazoletransferase n=1 Tax=Parasulfitobacter algicola TaxID=2614809 RepID=UPI001FE8664F|nr:adenosylcobinamide-GDP ribazoletransferase [Sulfitobacter algicola]